MRTTPIQGDTPNPSEPNPGDDPSHSQLLRSKPRLRDGPGLHCNGTSCTAPIPCDGLAHAASSFIDSDHTLETTQDYPGPPVPKRQLITERFNSSLPRATSLAQARQHWSLTLPVRNIPFHAPATGRNPKCYFIPHRRDCTKRDVPKHPCATAPAILSPSHSYATINPTVELHIPIQSHVTNQIKHPRPGPAQPRVTPRSQT